MILGPNKLGRNTETLLFTELKSYRYVMILGPNKLGRNTGPLLLLS